MSLQQRPLKIMLIGDACWDEYRLGRVDRLSPEAPVPIFVAESSFYKEGMAANVKNNLEKLGVNVVSFFGSFSSKVRLIDKKSKQHVLRIDNDVKSDPFNAFSAIDNSVDAIVISDYDKGYVSYEVINKCIDTGLPVFVDTKKTDLKRIDGAIVKINGEEFGRAISLPSTLIVTNGDKDVQLRLRRSRKDYVVPSIEITDVCGAGDTFLASFAYQYLVSTGDFDRSIKFAIAASSVTVRHIGVHAPTIEEILCQQD